MIFVSNILVYDIHMYTCIFMQILIWIAFCICGVIQNSGTPSDPYGILPKTMINCTVHWVFAHPVCFFCGPSFWKTHQKATPPKTNMVVGVVRCVPFFQGGFVRFQPFRIFRDCILWLWIPSPDGQRPITLRIYTRVISISPQGSTPWLGQRQTKLNFWVLLHIW